MAVIKGIFCFFIAMIGLTTVVDFGAAALGVTLDPTARLLAPCTLAALQVPSL